MSVSTRQRDDLDRLPPELPSGGRVAPWAGWAWRWQVVAVLAGAALLSLPLVKWLFGEWFTDGGWWWFVPIYAIVVLWLAKRLLLFERQPGGYKVPTRTALQVDAQWIMGRRL